MTREEFINDIERTYAECVGIVKTKNADYATSVDPFQNFRNAGAVGVSVQRAILVRIMDKISRVSNLLSKDASVVDESMTDTIYDAINYLAILKAFINDNNPTFPEEVGAGVASVEGAVWHISEEEKEARNQIKLDSLEPGGGLKTNDLRQEK